MIKYPLLILTLASLSIQAFGQNVFAPETHIGIKLGSNLSVFSTKPTIDQGLHFGYLGGLSFRHIQQKGLGIQVELEYQQAGWTEKLDSTNTYSRQLSYINIPFTTHISAGKGKTRFHMNLGPYISVLVAEKEKINLIGEEVPRDHYYKKADNIPAYGLCFGLGLTRYSSIALFQLEARVNQSLTNLFTSGDNSIFSHSRLQSIEVSLSYLMDYRKLNKGQKSSLKK